MNTKPRTLLILAGLFLAGVASGAFLTMRLAPGHHDRAPERRSFTERTLERMDRALVFTPEQRPQIEALLRTTGDELAKLRHESRRAALEQIRAVNTRIEALLTPEQRIKFRAFQKDQFERMRRHQVERNQREERGRPRNGDGPPPPPPGDTPEPPDDAPPPPR